jgi:hypothetical protein
VRAGGRRRGGAAAVAGAVVGAVAGVVGGRLGAAAGGVAAAGAGGAPPRAGPHPRRPGGSAPPPTPPPFYKRIPGTPFLVDAFQWASSSVSSHYVLTHFHSDHYGGLTRRFICGTIYASSVTASLAREVLGVRPAHLRPLPFDVPTTLVGGVRVTLMDANHCPGAALWLFEVPITATAAESAAAASTAAASAVVGYRAFLHTGDMRWREGVMASHPALRPYLPRLLPTLLLRDRNRGAAEDSTQATQVDGSGGGGGGGGGGGPGLFIPLGSPHPGAAAAGPMGHPVPPPPLGHDPLAPSLFRRLDAVYLDTTYCHPSYAFPRQEATLAAVRVLVSRYAHDPSVLLLFGAYSIGKERLWLDVAKALREKVWVDQRRFRTLNLLEWPKDDLAHVTTDPGAARIRVVPMTHLGLSRLVDVWKAVRAGAGAGTGGGGEAAAPATAPAAAGTTSSRLHFGAAGASSSSTTSSSSSSSSAAAAFPPRPKLPAALARKAKGRGAGFAALLAASAAAAAAAPIPGGPGGGIGGGHDGGGGVGGDDYDDEEEPDGAGFIGSEGRPKPRVRPLQQNQTATPARLPQQGDAASALMAGARVAAAAAAAAAAAPRYGPRFHSVVAFRPTGWAHAPAGTAPRPGRGAAAARASSAAGVGGGGGGGADQEGFVEATQGPRKSAATMDRGGLADEDDGEDDIFDDGDADGAGGAAAAAAAHGDGSTVEVRRAGVEVVMVAAPASAPGPGGGGGAPVPVRVTVQVRGSRTGAAIRSAHDVAVAAVPVGPGAGSSSSSLFPGGGVTLYSVPYSEHSSFTELRACVRELEPLAIVPTVNCRSNEDCKRLTALLKGGLG